MKRTLVTITLVAAAALILAIPAGAQGRSQNHPGSGSAAGSMARGHGVDATGPTGPHTPGQLLTQNKQLSSKLGALLPAGTDLPNAASGFRNLRPFLSALPLSHNSAV